MENNYGDSGDYSGGNGQAFLAVSFIMGFIGWIGKLELNDIIKVASNVISAVAGIMAAIYYWFAIKEKRMEIKRKEKNN